MLFSFLESLCADPLLSKYDLADDVFRRGTFLPKLIELLNEERKAKFDAWLDNKRNWHTADLVTSAVWSEILAKLRQFAREEDIKHRHKNTQSNGSNGNRGGGRGNDRNRGGNDKPKDKRNNPSNNSNPGAKGNSVGSNAHKGSDGPATKPPNDQPNLNFTTVCGECGKKAGIRWHSKPDCSKIPPRDRESTKRFFAKNPDKVGKPQ